MRAPSLTDSKMTSFRVLALLITTFIVIGLPAPCFMDSSNAEVQTVVPPSVDSEQLKLNDHPAEVNGDATESPGMSEEPTQLANYGVLSTSTGEPEPGYDESDDPYATDDGTDTDQARSGIFVSTDDLNNYDVAKAAIRKRNLGSLARQGDQIARKIQHFQKRLPETFDDDVISDDSGPDYVTDPDELELMMQSAAEKRYIGALARDNELPHLRYSVNRIPSPFKSTPWRRKPKRDGEPEESNIADDVIDDDEDDDDDDDDWELLSMMKKNIQSLARMGMTNLRTHRRPEENDVTDDVTVDKRNIQSLARAGFTGLRNQYRPEDASVLDDVINKRNIQSLARMGMANLRNRRPEENGASDDVTAEKRNIQSLARMGLSNLRNRRPEQNNAIDDVLIEKKNIQSLARMGIANLRNRRPEENGAFDDVTAEKRNIQSLARMGMANLRNRRPEENGAFDDVTAEKRNIQSLARMGMSNLRNRRPEENNAVDDVLIDKKNIQSLARMGMANLRTNRRPEENDVTDDDTPEKRNIQSLARMGMANLRTNRRPEENDVTDDVTADKRNIQSLARTGMVNLRTHRRPDDSDVINDVIDGITEDKRNIQSLARSGMPQLRTNRRPDENDVTDVIEADKRNIQSLARMGMTNLRTHRRPPSYGGEGEEDAYDYSARTTDGYKRNIQSLARQGAPGYGFRTWLRGQMVSPDQSPAEKRKLLRHAKYTSFGRRRQSNRDRQRGVRSTSDGFMDIPPRSPPPLLSRRIYSSDAVRAPMAFVSRRMFKRAAADKEKNSWDAATDDNVTANAIPGPNEGATEAEGIAVGKIGEDVRDVEQPITDSRASK